MAALTTSLTMLASQCRYSSACPAPKPSDRLRRNSNSVATFSHRRICPAHRNPSSCLAFSGSLHRPQGARSAQISPHVAISARTHPGLQVCRISPDNSAPGKHETNGLAGGPALIPANGKHRQRGRAPGATGGDVVLGGDKGAAEPELTTPAEVSIGDEPADNAPAKVIKIVGVSGSLRKGSVHTGILRAARHLAETAISNVEFEIVEILELPLYNEDIDNMELYPEAAKIFREKILGADAIFFSCPEYNYSVSGALKNAIDWGSRGVNVWDDKPATIVSSGGDLGGARAQYHLRQIGVYINLHFINKPELKIRRYINPSPFDAQGSLVDETSLERLESQIVALRDWAIRLQS